MSQLPTIPLRLPGERLLDLPDVPVEDMLAQTRPSVTTAEVGFTPRSRALVTAIFVANRHTSAATYSVFWDRSGTGFDDDTVIMPEIRLAATTADVIEVRIPLATHTHSLGVQSSIADAINFTIVGFNWEQSS